MDEFELFLNKEKRRGQYKFVFWMSILFLFTTITLFTMFTLLDLYTPMIFDFTKYLFTGS